MRQLESCAVGTFARAGVIRSAWGQEPPSARMDASLSTSPPPPLLLLMLLIVVAAAPPGMRHGHLAGTATAILLRCSCC